MYEHAVRLDYVSMAPCSGAALQRTLVMPPAVSTSMMPQVFSFLYLLYMYSGGHGEEGEATKQSAPGQALLEGSSKTPVLFAAALPQPGMAKGPSEQCGHGGRASYGI